MHLIWLNFHFVFQFQFSGKKTQLERNHVKQIIDMNIQRRQSEGIVKRELTIQ